MFVYLLTILSTSLLLNAQSLQPPGEAGENPQGTSIVRFAKVDDQIYRGSEPRTEADFVFLKRLGIRSILSLQILEEVVYPEMNMSKNAGIPNFFQEPIVIWIAEPDQTYVDEALKIMMDKRNAPVFIHCTLGRDRTGLLVGLYRVKTGEKNKQAALDEMDSFGFSHAWYVAGLLNYFMEHTK